MEPENNVIKRKLYRSRGDRIIAGVCGGLGEYFTIDPILVRLIFVLLAIMGGHGVLLYLLLAIIVPLEPGENVDVNRKEKIKEFATGVQAGVQRVARDLKENRSWFSNPRHLAGSIILFIGFAALFSQMFPEYWLGWEVMWPVLLLLIGLYIIIGK